MITREDDDLNIDYGLNVIFDEKKYRLATYEGEQDFKIGSLMCDYFRLIPYNVKDIIMSCDNLDVEATVENCSKGFMQLDEKLMAVLSLVTFKMVSVELFTAIGEWFDALRANRTQEYIDALNESVFKSVKEITFEDTSYSDFGGETVKQLFLTAFYSFAAKYATTKALFLDFVNGDEIIDDEQQKRIEVIASMYGDYIDMQHIDYRIIATQNGFESMYTIKSSLSLFIFEVAHCIRENTKIVKCKNCGNYFVPEGRNDAVYCSYPLSSDNSKTCKDVGAQITRANKEKNDAVTKEYRKVYMRYKMSTKRHPEDLEIATRFEKLTNEIREWRNKLAHGQTTVEEFMNWLNQF